MGRSWPSLTSTALFSFGRFLCRQWFLLVLLALLVSIRTGMVLFDIWSLEDGTDFPEALISGNFAFDVLQGAWRGWDTYLYITRGHMASILMVSCLALPLYAILGPSYFALSLVPTIYAAGLLILITYIGNRWFGRAVGGLAGLLFVAAPITLHGYEILPCGIFLEAGFYSFLAMTLACSHHEAKTARSRSWHLVALGVTCGIGLSHSELILLALACIFLFWWRFDRQIFSRKESLYFWLAFLVAAIPYVYFCTVADNALLRLTEAFLGRRDSVTLAYDPARESNSVYVSLTLLSLLFWPIDVLALRLLSGFAVTLIGLSLLAFTLLEKMFPKSARPFCWMLGIYVSVYLAVFIAYKGANRYYCYPIYPHVMILWASLFHTLPNRIAEVLGPAHRTLRRSAVVAPWLIVGGCSLANILPIVRGFDVPSFRAQLQKKQAINGCCFYWPGAYQAPGGPKTALTLTVEANGKATRFHEVPRRPGVRCKSIFVSPIRTGLMELSTPDSYYAYGKDVSTVGLPALADEIRTHVPVEYHPQAYAGLAVYYVNDHWLKQLLLAFESGLIEKHVPSQFQPVFYGELARKIRATYSDDQAARKRALARLTPRQQHLIETAQIVESPTPK